MEVKFCGAARAVTGSCHLITLENGFKILLDCGLYQGRSKEFKDFNETFLFDPKDLDLVIVSHAHIDHTGRIPKLVKDGYKGQFYCTHATRSLCAIMLLDSARIQERDASYHNRKNPKEAPKEALYTTKHVNEAMTRFVGLGYNIWHQVAPGIRLQFRDAGHLLGSASVTLEIKDGNREPVLVGFSGDIGRPKRPILRDPIQMPEVDYLITESTYGNRIHVTPEDETDRLIQIIHETCVKNRGKLLIPAFSIGRTQEVVYMLDQLETAGKLPSVPVYVDSPLAVDATQIFGAHPECYDAELNEYLLVDDNPFGFKKLKYIRDKRSSKKLNDSKEGCIIISAAGMMNAGRSKHHLVNSIDSPNNAVLFVGYCSPSTPGGQLRAGAEEINLFGLPRKVRMKIYALDSISGHGDKFEMRAFLSNQQKLKQTFLVHGAYEAQVEFRSFLEKGGLGDVEIPGLGQQFSIG
ncbi:MAG: MBL fold metallo-hydrolase [Bacteroidota bacterium]